MENLIEEPLGYECCPDGEEHIFFDEELEDWAMEIEGEILVVNYCPFCGEDVY